MQREEPVGSVKYLAVEKHSAEDTKKVLTLDNKAEQVEIRSDHNKDVSSEVGILDTQSKELWDMFNSMQQNTEQLVKRVIKLEERKERVERARYIVKSTSNSEQEPCDIDCFGPRIVEVDRETTALWEMFDSMQLDAELLQGRVDRLEQKKNANNKPDQNSNESDSDVFYSC